MKQLLLLFSVFFFVLGGSLSVPQKMIAQERQNGLEKNQQVFVEAGGPAGIIISFNYDGRFLPQQNGWGFRAGFAFWPDGVQRLYSVPLQLNYLAGKKQHLFEAGAGTTIYYAKFAGSYWGVDSNEGLRLFGSVSAGYRYLPRGRGLSARAGASLLVGSFLPVVTPQISLGYVF